MLPASRRSRLSDDVVEQLRLLIDDGHIQPGEQLPAERELAKQLGVGRTSLREGLRALEMAGLIETVPSKGIFRKQDAAGPVNKVLRSWLTLHKGTVLELIELREAVESQAAGLAAERASAADRTVMERAISAMRVACAANDADQFVEADTAFHDAIARASGNGLLRRTLVSIAREAFSYRLATARLGVAMLERSLADHAAILAAITAQDAEGARRAMREHIVRTPQAFHLLEQVAGDGRAE